MYQPLDLGRETASIETLKLFRRYPNFHVVLQGNSAPLDAEHVAKIIDRYIATLKYIYGPVNITFTQGDIGATEYSDHLYLASPFANDYSTGHAVEPQNLAELTTLLLENQTLKVCISPKNGEPTTALLFFDPEKPQIRLIASAPDQAKLRDEIVLHLFGEFLDVRPGFFESPKPPRNPQNLWGLIK